MPNSLNLKTQILRMTLTPTIVHCLLILACLAFTPGVTCASSEQESEVVQLSRTEFQLGAIHLNRAKRTLSMPAEVNLTNQVIEYALVSDQGKTHESLLRTSANPKDIHVAALLLGVAATSDLGKTNQPIRASQASRVRVEIEWQRGGKRHTNQIEDWWGLGTKSSPTLKRRLRGIEWVYNGSIIVDGHFIAQEEGSILSLIRDPGALLNNPGIDRDDDNIHYPHTAQIPPKGTPVTVLFYFLGQEAEKPAKQTQ